MPPPLRDSFRLERFGAPYSGGWMTWPLRWLIPVETARNVFDTVSAVNRAMSEYEGDALDKWRQRNQRLIHAALAIEEIRSEAEADGEKHTD